MSKYTCRGRRGVGREGERREEMGGGRRNKWNRIRGTEKRGGRRQGGNSGREVWYLGLDSDVCGESELARQRALELEHVLVRPGVVGAADRGMPERRMWQIHETRRESERPGRKIAAVDGELVKDEILGVENKRGIGRSVIVALHFQHRNHLSKDAMFQY